MAYFRSDSPRQAHFKMFNMSSVTYKKDINKKEQKMKSKRKRKRRRKIKNKKKKKDKEKEK